jgi:hypothetical protein
VSEGISFQLDSNGYLIASLQTSNSGVWSGTWYPIKFDGNWKHLAITANIQTGEIAYYVNGEPFFDDTWTMAPAPDSQFVNVSHTYIGQREPSTTIEGVYNSNHYKGMMDEIQLYNRSLNASEIKAIYQAGTRGVCR